MELWKATKRKRKAMALLSFTFWHLLAFSKSTHYNLDFFNFFSNFDLSSYWCNWIVTWGCFYTYSSRMGKILHLYVGIISLPPLRNRWNLILVFSKKNIHENKMITKKWTRQFLRVLCIFGKLFTNVDCSETKIFL